MAIHEIYSFLPDKRNYYEFQKDLKGKRAIERNIAIIGEEALNRILKVDPIFPIKRGEKSLIPETGLFMVTKIYQMVSFGMTEQYHAKSVI